MGVLLMDSLRLVQACDENMFMTHVFADLVGSARPKDTSVVSHRIWSKDHAFGSSATVLGPDKLSE